jgi:hypothetical protein
LIELGKANVNQTMQSIHATMMNRLDIVQFLIENKYSDVNQTKSSNHYKSVIHFLLERYICTIEDLELAMDISHNAEQTNTAFDFMKFALQNNHVDR